MSEPSFSSATAEVGDPVLCHLAAVQVFGHNIFPRGAYMGGHLEAEKDPGRFFGKGYLKIVFDRIAVPNSEFPLDAKIVAARGYHVTGKATSMVMATPSATSSNGFFRRSGRGK